MTTLFTARRPRRYRLGYRDGITFTARRNEFDRFWTIEGTRGDDYGSRYGTLADCRAIFARDGMM